MKCLGWYRVSLLLLALPLMAVSAEPISPLPGDPPAAPMVSGQAVLGQALLALGGLPPAPVLAPAPPAEKGPGAAAQLQAVRAAQDRQSVTLTLEISGEFSYVPTTSGERLLVVDLPGVESREPSASRLLDSTLVSSYRVVHYLREEKPSVRLEVLLKDRGTIEYRKLAGKLEVRVLAPIWAAAPAAVKPAAVPPAPDPVPAARMAAMPRANRLQKVTFQRQAESARVQVVANGTIQYKAFALANPDRLVLDIANVSNGVGRQPMVPEGMSPLRLVRVGQFRDDPPVTRVVMELERAAPYRVLPNANGVEVELLASAVGQPTVIPAPALRGPLAPSLNALFSSFGQLMATPKVELAAAAAPAKPEAKPAPAAPQAQPVVQAQAQPPSPPLIQPRATPVVVAPPEEPRAASPAIPVQPPAPAANPAIAQAMPPAQALTAGGVLRAPAQAPAPPAAAAKRYTGEPISINVKDVDLKDFFRLIHEISGLNVVLDKDVRGTVTMVLDDVPWDQALDIVLRNFQLDKVVEGNVLRIATLDTFKREQAARAELTAAEQASVERVTVPRAVNYANAEQLVPTLRKFLSPRAEIIADARTNMLIVTDIPQSIPNLDFVLSQLDRRTKQVEIEARVVAASREFVRELGAQFGFATVAGGRTLFGGNPVGDNSSPITGRPSTPPFSISGGQAIPLISNFPAAGANSGLTISHDSPNFALDLILTAAERRGIGKTLSRPKIITQNNRQGLIQQGVKIPVQTTVNNTISVQFVDVTLKMQVTPQITAENTVFLNVDVTNSQIDPGIARINGIPALDTQQATTQVLVNDGGTIVFGGVILNENNLTIEQVPLLGSIPVIGHLFKRTGVSTRTSELLFFITPKIV